MSIVVDEARPKRSPGRRRKREGTSPRQPSVREVCLLGTSPNWGKWASGDRLTRSGRAYRVTAADSRYVHLATADDD